jgi:hypothetical protein
MSSSAIGIDGDGAQGTIDAASVDSPRKLVFSQVAIAMPGRFVFAGARPVSAQGSRACAVERALATRSFSYVPPE